MEEKLGKRRPRDEEEEGFDRLSNLPDSILISIISRLPVKTAAATTVLSHRWRRVWIGITSLHTNTGITITTLEHILAQVRSFYFEEFSVQFDTAGVIDDGTLLGSCLTRVRRRIKVTGLGTVPLSFTLPSTLFSSTSLVELHLIRNLRFRNSFLEFTHPPDLPSLRRLGLFLPVSESAFLTPLLRACPLLESLNLSVRATPNRSDCFVEYSDRYAILISSPYLQHLRLFVRTVQFTTSLTLDLPSLESCTIFADNLAEACTFLSPLPHLLHAQTVHCYDSLLTSLLSNFSNVTSLCIGPLEFMYGAQDESLLLQPFRLPHLTHLSFLLTDLRSVSVYMSHSDPPVLLDVASVRTITIEMRILRRPSSVLGFATHLLRFATLLELLHFRVCGSPKPARKADVFEVETGFCDSLSQLPPASPRIVFSGREVHKILQDGKQAPKLLQKGLAVSDLDDADSDDGPLKVNLEDKVEHPQVLVPVADGTEPMEAVIIIDILRRAGAKVTVASVGKELGVQACHGVKIVADLMIDDCSTTVFDLISLPGGLPGASTLRDCQTLKSLVKRQAEDGRLCAAISDAPAVALGSWGLLNGLELSSSATAVESWVKQEGSFVTSHGPGTAIRYSVVLVELLCGTKKADEITVSLVMQSYYGDGYLTREFNSVEWTFNDCPQILVAIAEGSEEMEVVMIIDILRRAKAKVVLASVGKKLEMLASWNVKLVADVLLDEAAKSSYDLIVLPGGFGGAQAFAASEKLIAMLKEHMEANRPYGAICVSPALVLEPHGLLKGKKATAFPAICNMLSDPTEIEYDVVVDGNLITSRGPGTSMEFALGIVEKFYGLQKAMELAKELWCVHN